LTRFRKLAEIELPVEVDRYPTSRYALLEVEPITGRRHQIRRHLKHIAHPVIGDATLRQGAPQPLLRGATSDCHRLLLACVRLCFDHPADGRRLEIKAPVSGEFAATLARFGWTETQ
jgi:tRNA pseudouridine65 synthase